MKKTYIAMLVALFAAGLANAQNPVVKEHKPFHKNVPCVACHKEETPKAPTVTTCTECHGTAEDVAKKTEGRYKKYYNPHNSLHYATYADCVLCHREHSQSRLDCTNSRCHSEFSYKTP